MLNHSIPKEVTFIFRVMKYFLILIGVIFIQKVALSQQLYNSQLTDYPAYEVVGIETSNNVLVVAWMEDDSLITDPDTVSAMDKVTALKVSNDGGLTWSTKRIFDDTTRNTNANPTLASDDNGVIYLIKMSVDGPPNPNKGTLDFYRSIDDGKSWSQVKKVVPASNLGFADKPWLIAKGNGELFLVYTDFMRQSPDSDAKFMRSLDSGKTWSSPVSLSTGATVGPSINFGPNNEILVCWATSPNSDGAIYFTKSTDNGLTFQTPVAVTSPPVPGWTVTEIISSSNNNQITIVFHSTHYLGFVGSISSIDGGVSWASPNFHSNSGNLISGDIDTAGSIHILYNELFNGISQNTLIASSMDSGTTFSMPTSLYQTAPLPVSGLDKYIGAYQSLICSKNSDIKHAFWIDWSDNKFYLNYSAWPRSPSFSIKDDFSKSSGVEVFPNPFNAEVSIVSNGLIPGITYNISNSIGVSLLNGVVKERGKLKLNLLNLPKGIYILQLLDSEDKIHYSSKLIKN
jgi:hypothetical protein